MSTSDVRLPPHKGLLRVRRRPFLASPKVLTQTEPMSPNDQASARSRRFLLISGWVAAPVGIIGLATGIIKTATGTGVGWIFIVLGLVLLGLGIVLIRVLAQRPGAPRRP